MSKIIESVILFLKWGLAKLFMQDWDIVLSQLKKMAKKTDNPYDDHGVAALITAYRVLKSLRGHQGFDEAEDFEKDIQIINEVEKGPLKGVKASYSLANKTAKIESGDFTLNYNPTNGFASLDGIINGINVSFGSDLSFKLNKKVGF